MTQDEYLKNEDTAEAEAVRHADEVQVESSATVTTDVPTGETAEGVAGEKAEPTARADEPVTGASEDVQTSEGVQAEQAVEPQAVQVSTAAEGVQSTSPSDEQSTADQSVTDEPPKRRKVLGVLSLCFGLVSLVLMVLTVLIWPLGIATCCTALAALVLGIVGCCKRHSLPLSIIGLVTSSIALLLTPILLIVSMSIGLAGYADYYDQNYDIDDILDQYYDQYFDNKHDYYDDYYDHYYDDHYDDDYYDRDRGQNGGGSVNSDWQRYDV